MGIDVVAFDIGNVVLDFDFSIMLGRASRLCGRRVQDIADWFSASGLEREFELGRIAPETFHIRVVEGLGLPMDFQEFKMLWNSIFTQTLGTESILAALSKKVHLAAGSNTNPLHLEHIRATFPVLEVFQPLLASCEVGLRKPEPDFYRALCKAVDAPGEKVLFIDDLESNVSGAKRTGLQATLFRGARDLKRQLKIMKLLD